MICAQGYGNGDMWPANRMYLKHLPEAIAFDAFRFRNCTTDLKTNNKRILEIRMIQ